MTNDSKQVEDAANPERNGGKTDKQTKAMSRRIPRDPTVETDDQMQEALTETRVGAVRADREDHPPQEEALGNTFELDDGDESGDQMREAMSERRKSVDK